MINNNLDNIYIKVLDRLMTEPLILNKRTGVKIKSLWGVNFDWNMNYYPLLNCRQMFPKTGAAELAWMLQGTKDVSFMRKYSKIWDKFTDEGNTDEIKTAYGYRWSQAFGYDQIDNIISKLKEDPSSRQQVLMNWDPRVDNVEIAKNIPCPFTVVVGIINNRLNLHLTVRSNDFVIGFPYDIFVYTMLGNAIANELGISPGVLHYSIANCHIYETHFKEVKKLLTNYFVSFKYEITNKSSICEIRANPDLYVEMIANDILNKSGYTMNKEKINFEVIK